MSVVHRCYALTPRTATPAGAAIVTKSNSRGARGLLVVIDVTAKTSSPSVVFTVSGVDAISGKSFTLIVSAAITAVGTTLLRIYPGLTPAANLVVSDVLPAQWKITPVHGNGDSITYSVSAHELF